MATNDSDIDDGASLTYSLNAPVAGLTIAANGGYSFNAGHADYQHLAQGATTAVVANYTVTDQHGANSTSTLTITLTGTNDTPVAVAEALQKISPKAYDAAMAKQRADYQALVHDLET